MGSVVKLGSSAPDFELLDLAGKPQRLSEQQGKIVVLIFWSATCPWAQLGDEILRDMEAIQISDVLLWTIAVNADETRDLIKQVAGERRLRRVLRDEGQAIADLYEAMATPHVYVIDERGALRYRGAIDDRTFRQRVPTKNYLEDALWALLAGGDPEISETPAYGCAIVRDTPE